MGAAYRAALILIAAMVVLLGCSVRRVSQEERSTVQSDTYLQRGYEYLQQRDWTNAIGEFQRAVAFDPDSALAHAGLGWAYYRSGRADLALKEGEEVLRLEPENEQVRALVELLRQQQRGASRQK